MCLAAGALTANGCAPAKPPVLPAASSASDDRSGTITPARPRLANLLVRPYGRYLFRPDGRPFLYLADTCWELFRRATLDEARLYLDNRAVKGFTVVQTALVAGLDGTAQPNRDGQLPFVDGRPNLAYFDFADRVMEEANRRGLVVAVAPAWGGYLNGTSEVEARAYGRFLGDRFKNRDLIWVLGGDRNPTSDDDRKVVAALAEGLHEGDDRRHLLTFLPASESSSGEFFHEASWLDFNTYRTGHSWPNMPEPTFVADEFDRNPPRPALDGESAFEDWPFNGDPQRQRFSPYFVRKLAYAALVSGAAGHAYGHGSVSELWEPGRQSSSFARMPWRQALDAPAAQQVAAAGRLFQSRPFERLAPEKRLIVDDGDEGKDNELAALADDRSFAFIYAPEGRPITIDLSLFRAEDVQAHVWDPRTGTAQTVGRVPAAGPHQFRFPVERPGRDRDYLLVLDKAGESFPPPGMPYQRTAPPIPPPDAKQRLLVDGYFNYTDDGFNGDVEPPDPLPGWTGREDLRHGTLHVRVDVLTRPRKPITTTLLLRFASGPHQDRTQYISFGEQKVQFDKRGVFHFTLPVSSYRPLVEQDNFRWDAPIAHMQLAVADAEGRRVSQWEQDLGKFPGNKKDHLPLRVRYTAYVVAPGHTFTPPTFW